MDKCDKYFNQKLKENYTYITAHTGCEGTVRKIIVKVRR